MGPVVFTLCAQEKERAWHQQELDKALKSLEREKTELEMRLREQQAETEAVRMQREEERAEAESTLRQVGSWEDWLCCHPVISFLPLATSFSTPKRGAAGPSKREHSSHSAAHEQVIGTVSCRASVYRIS